jgi:cyclophilin family peptidyl-prolyl cis-trans isomerase
LALYLVALVAAMGVEEGIGEDGIYADFETSLGDFSARLYHEEAPRTVANFVGLAEGQRDWIDFGSGLVERGKAFYDGLIFHRVIAGFMSQTGSRNGLGTDGPGYVIRDEIVDGLEHDRAHLLSMANSGPHSNGAQFFVTAAATPWLDGLHSIFGEVVSGGGVVDAINAVATDGGDRPLEPVVIQRVSIRRVGESAEAFDVGAWGLPLVEEVDGDLALPPGAGVVVEAGFGEGEEIWRWRSEDMKEWGALGSIYRGGGLGEAGASVIDGFGGLLRAFYRLARARYLDGPAPGTLAGRSFDLAAPGLTLKYQIGGDGINGSLWVEFDDEGSAGFGSATEVFELVSRPYGMDVILDSPDINPRYLLVKMLFDGVGEAGPEGRHSISFWTGSGWEPLFDGTFEMVP